MNPPQSSSALEIAAATLRGIWAAMLSRFGGLGVAAERQMVTANWVSAIFQRFDALLLRYQAGKLRRVLSPRVLTTGRKAAKQPESRMPRRFGWLVRSGAHHAAAYGTQVQHVLSGPEMAELLATSPQAMRILRPLLRALAVELPWTVDKPRTPRQRRPRKPRPKPEPFRIPLPRGVLSAARRQGFGKLR